MVPVLYECKRRESTVFIRRSSYIHVLLQVRLPWTWLNLKSQSCLGWCKGGTAKLWRPWRPAWVCPKIPTAPCTTTWPAVTSAWKNWLGPSTTAERPTKSCRPKPTTNCSPPVSFNRARISRPWRLSAALWGTRVEVIAFALLCLVWIEIPPFTLLLSLPWLASYISCVLFALDSKSTNPTWAVSKNGLLIDLC